VRSPSRQRTCTLMRLLDPEDVGTALLRNFGNNLVRTRRNIPGTGNLSNTDARISNLTALFIVLFLTFHEFRLKFAIFSL